MDTPEVHDLLVRFQTNDERLAVSNLFSTDGQSLSSSNLAVGQRILDTTRNVGLLRDDGVLQGRWPEVTDPDRVYAAPNNGFLLDKLRGEGFPDSGRAEGRGTLVDAQRLIAFHRVPGYPLTAFVAIPNSAGWREWIETAWLPFLLFALMAGCSVWIYRYGSRHRALWEQELQARQSGLEFRNEISGHAIQGLGMEELVRIVVLETVKHFHGMWCAYSTVDAQGLLQVKESSQTEGGPSLDGRWICPSSPPTSPRCATRSRSF